MLYRQFCIVRLFKNTGAGVCFVQKWSMFFLLINLEMGEYGKLKEWVVKQMGLCNRVFFYC